MRDWYYGGTHYFELKVHQGNLTPQRLEESQELRKRIDKLAPRMLLQESIRDKDIPLVELGDIEVLSEISDPGPLQPGEVKVGKDVQFFKPVDLSQPQTTKREIEILTAIADRGLQNEIPAPRLLGFVAFPDSSTEIMGLLLTNIPNAHALTKLLDSYIAEEKRLNKGDQMGLDKIVDALIDPDENTFDPEDDDEDDGDYTPPRQSSKRKRADDEDEDEGEKRDSPSYQGDRKYCYCDGVSSGEMVACDGDHCVREWFRLECLGLDSPPKTDRWYCDDCEAGPGH